MPKFMVKVKVVATCEYEVEVDARSEREAEGRACSTQSYASHTPDDFQVEKSYCAFLADAQKLTADCPECGKEHPLANENTMFCTCPWTFGGERHIIVDGVCVRSPWGPEDQDYCHDCDVMLGTVA